MAQIHHHHPLHVLVYHQHNYKVEYLDYPSCSTSLLPAPCHFLLEDISIPEEKWEERNEENNEEEAEEQVVEQVERKEGSSYYSAVEMAYALVVAHLCPSVSVENLLDLS